MKRLIQSGNGLDVYEKPIENHDYVCTVDVARGGGQDYSETSLLLILLSILIK